MIAGNQEAVLRHWILGLSRGDEEAAERLWKHYYPRVRAAVAGRLAQMPHLAGETSDIASEALHLFFYKIGSGDFHQLAEVNSLWGFLRTITLRKLNDSLKSAKAVKRGGRMRRVDVDPDFVHYNEPDIELDVKDLVDRLVDVLESEKDQMIVKLRWQGFSPGDVAEMMGVSVRTVLRRIKVIEDVWKRRFENLLSL